MFVKTTRTGGSACAVSVLCERRSLSLSRARARACRGVETADASNEGSNGAGVYPRASEDAASEDAACGRSREKRARAI